MAFHYCYWCIMLSFLISEVYYFDTYKSVYFHNFKCHWRCKMKWIWHKNYCVINSLQYVFFSYLILVKSWGRINIQDFLGVKYMYTGYILALKCNGAILITWHIEYLFSCLLMLKCINIKWKPRPILFIYLAKIGI